MRPRNRAVSNGTDAIVAYVAGFVPITAEITRPSETPPLGISVDGSRGLIGSTHDETSLLVARMQKYLRRNHPMGFADSPQAGRGDYSGVSLAERDVAYLRFGRRWRGKRCREQRKASQD